MGDKERKTTRLVLASALIFGAYLASRAYGLDAYFQAEHIRALVAEAGPWGPVAFVVLFVAAVVGQVPGLIFVAAAPALFQWPEAWILCFVASNLAVVLNFELVRRIGGQPLQSVQKPWLKKLFGALDAHPVRTVAILRTVTVMFPPVTGALALTRISARQHAIGSAIGMLLPVTVVLLATAFLLR